MKILYVGPDYPGSNGTCWRDAFIELGHTVHTLNDEKFDPVPATLAGRWVRKLRRRPESHRRAALQRTITEAVGSFQPELIFFVKAYHVEPGTLETVRRTAPSFVYMNDDMFNPANQTPTFYSNLPNFDLILTTKSYNVRELHRAGARRAVYVANAYDPRIHYPCRPSESERESMGGDVAFIGTFRPSRADFLNRIVRLREFRLNVWGGGWGTMGRIDYLHRRMQWRSLRESVHPLELWCGEMGKAIQANRITLGLLYHENRDLQTSRSFEIPACGGFMLAERTEEHRMYFEEDKEAAYFSTFEELRDKLRFYVAHDAARERIAAAGYRRSLESPYRYLDRARFALQQLGSERPRMQAAGVEHC